MARKSRRFKGTDYYFTKPKTVKRRFCKIGRKFASPKSYVLPKGSGIEAQCDAVGGKIVWKSTKVGGKGSRRKNPISPKFHPPAWKYLKASKKRGKARKTKGRSFKANIGGGTYKCWYRGSTTFCMGETKKAKKVGFSCAFNSQNSKYLCTASGKAI